MDDAISIGLVGCGSWGKLILRDLVSLGCRVTVVARSEATRSNARIGGAAGVVSRATDLPRTLDGYIVATPLPDHAGTVAGILERGRPVFCEKPLTDDPVAAETLARLAPHHLFVMDKWRYHAGVLALARAAREATWGRAIGLYTRRVGWGNPHIEADSVWTLLPHDLSIALEILGEVPTPLSAVAEFDADGVPVGLRAFGRVGQAAFAAEVSSANPVRDRSVRLVCADAIIVLPEPMSDHCLVQRGRAGGKGHENVSERLPIAVEMPLLEELRAFVLHLRGGPRPRSSAAEGASIVAACAAFRRLAGLA